MSDQRGGSLRGPEERGTARDLGFELIFLWVRFELILVVVGEEMLFLTMVIQIFARLLGTCVVVVVWHRYCDMHYGHDLSVLVTGRLILFYTVLSQMYQDRAS